ncbi:MAG: DsbA family protein [Sphingomonadaceae bacterium]|nr:DsbA family protein [Sphingomonadaceae bacterium]
MRLRAIAAAFASLLLLALPASSQAQRARPHAAAHVAQRDWSQMAVRTPEGGVRIGNPAAPVKLVEYGSITCPHCAHFSGEAAQALRARYVRSGRVSWEYRPYLIFPTDPGLFMLLNCLGPARFFPAAEQLYATQSQWVGRVQALPPEQFQQMQNLPPNQQAAALVRATGLAPFFRARGMTDAQMNACLANRAGIERLGAISQYAVQLGVQGTPTFIVNGRLVGTQDWARLEPMLAGG